MTAAGAGQAFPSVRAVPGEGGAIVIEAVPGMTERRYIAVMAMAAMMSDYGRVKALNAAANKAGHDFAREVRLQAYLLADEMLQDDS